MQRRTRERDYGGIKNNAKEQEVRKTDEKTGKSGKTQDGEKQRGWNNEWEELRWERERCARMMWIHCLEAPREAGKSLYRELERWTLFMSKGLREEMLWEPERGWKKEKELPRTSCHCLLSAATKRAREARKKVSETGLLDLTCLLTGGVSTR